MSDTATETRVSVPTQYVECDALELRRAILSVWRAAASNDAVPTLQSVRVSVHRDSLRFTATDRYRLAESLVYDFTPAPGIDRDDWQSVLIDARELRTLAQAVSAAESRSRDHRARLSLGEHGARLSVIAPGSGETVASRATAQVSLDSPEHGRFPKTAQLWQSREERSVSEQSSTLLAALLAVNPLYLSEIGAMASERLGKRSLAPIRLTVPREPTQPLSWRMADQSAAPDSRSYVSGPSPAPDPDSDPRVIWRALLMPVRLPDSQREPLRDPDAVTR